MKKDLIELLNKFVLDMNNYNERKKNAEHTNFEDSAEPTLWNFIKWLNFEK